MALLYLFDILKKFELNLSEVLLIRHALSDKTCKEYYESGNFREYTQIQKSSFPINYKYWITFIGENRNSAILYKCYSVKKSEQNLAHLNLNDTMKKIIQAKCYDKEPVYFDIEEIDLLKDFENRLIIDWGNPRAWTQKAENKKEIIAIRPKQKQKFESYDNLIFTYEELREIIEDNLTYAD